MSRRQSVRNWWRLGPPARDHLPAARIAAGVAAPLLTLLWLGRLDLAVFATFAAFTGIYARHEPPGARLRHQAQSALLLLTCLALGLLLSRAGASLWAVTLTGAVTAGAGALLAAVWGLRPAGALFFVFALTTAGTLPAPPSLAEAMGTAAVTAAFCLLLGHLGARYSARVRPAELASPPGPVPGPDVRWHGLRHLIAALLGGVVGMAPGVGHTAWAMVAAVAPISAQDHQGRVKRAVQRVTGTLGGLLISAALLAVPWQPWLLVVWVIALQFLAELYVVRNYSVALLFVTPLALLMAHLGHPDAASTLLWARAVETVLGALAGLVVVLLVRSPAERRAPRSGTPRGTG